MWRKDHPLSNITLSWRQKRIVKYPKNVNQYVIAGAGTGKTKVLIARIQYVLWKYQCKPDEILAMTFSGRAANEIIDRLKKFEPNRQFHWIDTFHGICRKFLIEEKKLTEACFVRNRERTLFVNKICAKSKLNSFSLNAVKFDEINRLIKLEDQAFEEAFVNVYKSFGNEQNRLVEKSQIIQHVKDLYQQYTDWLKYEQKYDCEDSVHLVDELLKKNEVIREKWQKRFKFIFVDEFQDIDRVQYEIICRLCNSESKVFVVSDEDQAIYGWRGANVNLDQKFGQDFLQIKRSSLKQNYRSSKNILKVANKLIKNNKNRLKKRLFTKNSKGEKVTYYHALGQIDEAKWIVSKINRLVNEQKNSKFSDIAIICREHRWQKAIEEELALNNFPYQISQDKKFYDQPEIKRMIEYLKVIIFKDNKDYDQNNLLYNAGISLLKIKKQDLDEIKNFASRYKILIYCAFRVHYLIPNLDSSTHTIIAQFLTNLDRIEDLLEHQKQIKFHRIVKIIQHTFKETFSSLSSDQQENLSLFSKALGEFEKDHPQSSIADFLKKVSMFYQSEQTNSSNQIQIMTIHKVKGLEFPCVFVTGLVNGIFPKNYQSTRLELEEERRNFYVALTRAKRHLYLSSCNWINPHTNKPMFPCQFVDEIKPACKVETKFRHVV